MSSALSDLRVAGQIVNDDTGARKTTHRQATIRDLLEALINEPVGGEVHTVYLDGDGGFRVEGSLRLEAAHLTMSLGEALALLSTENGLLNEIDRHNAEAYVAAVAAVVAAARNWHALTSPSTELVEDLIERGALWVSRVHKTHAASVPCVACQEVTRAVLLAVVERDL